MRFLTRFSPFIASVAIVIACPVRGDDSKITVKAALTYGIGGPERSSEILCGEAICIATSIGGMTADAAGSVGLQMQTEMLTTDGQLTKIVPSPNGRIPLPLGGDTMRVFSSLPIPRETIPGKYLIRVGVRDNDSGNIVTQEIPITVLDRSTFGALGLRLSRDARGQLPGGAVFFTGDTANVHFSAAGYQIQDGKMRLRTTLQALDTSLKPVSPVIAKFEPQRNVSSSVDEQLGLYLSMNLNRSGTFVLRLTVEDLIAGRKVVYDLPVVVTDLDSFDLHRISGNRQQNVNR